MDYNNCDSEAEDPLIDFASRWYLDGDYLRCRLCHRPQIIGCGDQDFPHVAGCKGEESERNPWKTLADLINARIESRTAEAAISLQTNDPIHSIIASQHMEIVNLRRLVTRLTNVAEDLAGGLVDPGSEAFAAIYCGKHFLYG